MINEKSVLSDFDILAAAGGQNKAIVRSLSTRANDWGQIIVQFSRGSADEPKISGIEINK